MRERTLLILKPDLAARESDALAVLIRVLALGFVPTHLVRGTMSTWEASLLYHEHRHATHFARNVAFMTSGPSIVVALEAEDACARLRELVGSTDPSKAQPGTLRATYGTGLPQNAVRASANAAEAEREIGIFFGGEQ